MSRAILAGIILLIGIHAFDELVLVIALPSISHHLGLENLYGLTIAVYILAATSGMSAAGKYIDQIGPRKVLIFGLGCFIAGIIISAISTNGVGFIIARILQGLGGGVCVTSAFALINLCCDAENKGTAITAMDFAWVVPSVSAPTIGGLIVDYVDWRWIFIIQAPVLILIAYLLLPKLKHLDKHNSLPSYTVVADALRIAVGTGLLLYILSTPPSLFWLFIVVAVWIGLPSFNRVMPAFWYSGKTKLALPILVGMLSFTTFYGMEAFQPLYLIQYIGISTTQAGLIVTVGSISWLLGSTIAMRLYKILVMERVLLLGNSFLLLGTVALGIVSLSEAPIWTMYPSWGLAGLGMGLTFNAVRTSSMMNTPKDQEGFVATAITLASNMGIGLSSGLGGAIKNQLSYSNGDMRDVLLYVILFGVTVCTLTLLLIALRSQQFKHHRLAGTVTE